MFWQVVTPITAISYFSRDYKAHPLILQYAMRVLESYEIDVVFFYIPQLVQVLRFDAKGKSNRSTKVM